MNGVGNGVAEQRGEVLVLGEEAWQGGRLGAEAETRKGGSEEALWQGRGRPGCRGLTAMQRRRGQAGEGLDANRQLICSSLL